MNPNDLRVIKTRENIFNSFVKLLAKKPMYKITVHELCETARINKGTFYYHYEDIYDLYKECVKKEIATLYDVVDCYDKVTYDPVAILKAIKQHEKTYHDSVNTVLQDKSMSYYKDMIIDGFIDRTYLNTSLRKSDDTDARLYTIYNTVLELSPRYKNREYVAEKVLMDLAKGLFPCQE